MPDQGRAISSGAASSGTVGARSAAEQETLAAAAQRLGLGTPRRTMTSNVWLTASAASAGSTGPACPRS